MRSVHRKHALLSSAWEELNNQPGLTCTDYHAGAAVAEGDRDAQSLLLHKAHGGGAHQQLPLAQVPCGNCAAFPGGVHRAGTPPRLFWQRRWANSDLGGICHWHGNVYLTPCERPAKHR